MVAFFGCEKDNVTSTDSLTSDDALVSAKIDVASDDVSNIVDQLFDNIDGSTIAYRGVNNDNSVFSNCATITRVPAFGTVITPGTQVTKTIDFGTTGCQLNNGNIVKGKIIISFVFQPTAVSHTVTYTFDNFYHNSIPCFLTSYKLGSSLMVAFLSLKNRLLSLIFYEPNYKKCYRDWARQNIIEKLNFHQNQIENTYFLSFFPNLQWLDLSNNRISIIIVVIS
mgnify:CR=1 FL=1